MQKVVCEMYLPFKNEELQRGRYKILEWFADPSPTFAALVDCVGQMVSFLLGSLMELFSFM